MNNYRKHIDKLPDARIAWSRSSEEVWESLEKSLDQMPEARTVRLGNRMLRLSIAASVLILIGFAAFSGLYTKKLSTPSGQVAEISLPGGSKIILNADSEVKYKPLLWRFSRDIKLDGEAFFSVKPGNEFRVVSEKGLTSVLGTSFNIYSRSGEYSVVCYTGKVRVEPVDNNAEVILNPKQKAILLSEGKIIVEDLSTPDKIMDWRSGYFRFTSDPLNKVFDEISRQYDLNIQYDGIPENLYTGSFYKDQNAEDVINMVCKSIGGIKFVPDGDRSYRIIINEE